MKKIECSPIGEVRADEARGRYYLNVDAAYREGLRAVREFGRIHVLWWAHGLDDPRSRAVLSCELPYAPGTRAGVFACRSPARPNPILVAACGVVSVDEVAGTVVLDYIDALDGSPLLDLKPYIPVSDRAREFAVPSWFRAWPEWIEDAFAFFSGPDAPNVS